MAVTALAIGAIAAPIIGGIAGNIAASGDRAAAQAAADHAYQIALQLGMPPDESKQLILQQFKSAGVLNPDLESYINAGPSQAAQIQEDPQTRQAQMDALQQMQQLGRSGLGAQDRASMNELRQQSDQDTQSRIKQIEQAAAQRGQAGGGADLAAQLSAAQGGANRLSQGGDQIASQAADRALQALSQTGGMAGQLRSQDFSNNMQKAQAADQMQRFNVQNQISTQQRNTAAQNAAQAANLQNSQRISDSNAQLSNAEQEREAQATERYWQDQYQRSQLQSNAALGQASQHQNNAGQVAQQFAGIGGGAGSAFGSLAKYYANKGTTPNTTAQNGGSNTSYQVGSGANGGGGAAGADDFSNAEPVAAYGGVIHSQCYNCGGVVHDNSVAYHQGGMCMQHGGQVPGQAPVPGDSFKNDIVNAKLSPGEIVIPREVVQRGPDAGFGYLHAILNKNKQVK